LYVQGYNYRLTGSDIEALNSSTEQFEYNELEVELIHEFLMEPVNDRAGEFLTASQIKNLIEANTEHRVSPVKLGRALGFAGFKRVKGKMNKKWVLGYRIHPDSKVLIVDNEKNKTDGKW